MPVLREAQTEGAPRRRTAGREGRGTGFPQCGSAHLGPSGSHPSHAAELVVVRPPPPPGPPHNTRWVKGAARTSCGLHEPPGSEAPGVLFAALGGRASKWQSCAPALGWPNASVLPVPRSSGLSLLSENPAQVQKVQDTQWVSGIS